MSYELSLLSGKKPLRQSDSAKPFSAAILKISMTGDSYPVIACCLFVIILCVNINLVCMYFSYISEIHRMIPKSGTPRLQHHIKLKTDCTSSCTPSRLIQDCHYRNYRPLRLQHCTLEDTQFQYLVKIRKFSNPHKKYRLLIRKFPAMHQWNPLSL